MFFAIIYLSLSLVIQYKNILPDFPGMGGLTQAKVSGNIISDGDQRSESGSIPMKAAPVCFGGALLREGRLADPDGCCKSFNPVVRAFLRVWSPPFRTIHFHHGKFNYLTAVLLRLRRGKMAGKRITVKTIAAMKKREEKIVALTAYDYHTAHMEEMAGVHIILVGDSFQMAVLGEETTLGASMDVLVAHCRAVRKGAPDTLVVGDMPFGSYQPSDEIAVINAVRFIAEAGADAVKLEGGNRAAISRVKAIVDAGIPVMGHIGLLPQSIKSEGSYRVVRSDSEEMLLKQIGDLEKAGAFSTVLEMIEEDVATRISEASGIATIGIGAGRYTHGQILVVNDMLGMNSDFNPRFLKKYADLHSIMKEAIGNYVSDVAGGVFPGEENVFEGRGKSR